MKDIQKKNSLLGFLFFLIAATIYTCTTSSTPSLWDCSEYIACAFKLQVPHPPGAPLFLLLGRLFSLLAGGNVEKVAFWVNMSVVMTSAATVMVLFQVILLLGAKICQKNIIFLTSKETYSIWLAASIGAFSLMFCDTFWSIATEAEIYGPAVLIMLLCVWAMLRWEMENNNPRVHKWLVLIAYLMGLSLGLRMFSLLTFPALSLLFYSKKTTQITIKGVITTLVIGVLLMMMIYIGVLQGVPKLAICLELHCVNKWQFPFYSGVLFLGIGILMLLIFGLTYAAKKHRATLHIGLLCLGFLLVGYTSHILVFVCSQANPPINEGAPSDIMRYSAYVMREQYGQKPLWYGPSFTAQPKDQQHSAPVYKKTATCYTKIGYKPKYVFDKNEYTFFPRLWSTQPAHIAVYKAYLHLGEKQRPTLVHNLKFLVRYQLGDIYLRYFFWNFGGKERCTLEAPCLTPLDAFKKVPLSFKNNGRSNYLWLPLLLGILGLVFQYKRDKRSFFVLMILFIMLGMAIAVFLNVPPTEPRARDYIYVGSFVIFTIWIGLGTLCMIDFLQKKVYPQGLALLIGGGLCSIVPSIMVLQGWHSHDRSQQYFVIDMAKNLLNTCPPNAILFTGGDNDTFPLWYAQEVEGIRTDVRVIVLPYANADWYIQQMRWSVNQSSPLPISLNQEQYQQYGLNDYIPYVKRSDIPGSMSLDMTQYLQLVQQRDPGLQLLTTRGSSSNSIPTKKLYLSIDQGNVLEKNIIPNGYEACLVEKMIFSLKEGYLEKKELLLMDLLVTNNWERPIYFTPTALKGFLLDLKEYVVTEGCIVRLLPIKKRDSGLLVHQEKMYHHMMEQFQWRGLNIPHMHYDENIRGFCMNYRKMSCSLATSLLKSGKVIEGKKILLQSLAKIPHIAIPYDGNNVAMIPLLCKVGEEEKALHIVQEVVKWADDFLLYKIEENKIDQEVKQTIAVLKGVVVNLYNIGYKNLSKKYYDILYNHYQMLKSMGYTMKL